LKKDGAELGVTLASGTQGRKAWIFAGAKLKGESFRGEVVHDLRR
jgi:hypothetical protein|tara:strand:- start:112 stop:246 length:135 start_codon:yes stop_codon:yes gene_type:complete